jgi:hypothetical protein
MTTAEVETGERDEQLPELPDNIITHTVAREGEPIPPNASIKCDYLMCAPGVMVRARREGLDVCLPVAYTESPLPGLAHVEPYARFEHPRVPEALVAEMIERSRSACRGRTDSEFLESLFHLTVEDGDWRLHEPEQARRHSSVRPADDGPGSSYAEALVEVHVHPDDTPDFSEQDDFEESGKFRVFGIIYNLWSPRPRFRVRVGAHDHFCQVPAGWLFQLPVTVADAVAEEIAARHVAEEYGGS